MVQNESILIMKNTAELLEKVIDFHGGADFWNQQQGLEAHLNIGGVTWPLKGHDDPLKDVQFKADLHQQKGIWKGIFSTNTSSEFSPLKVSLLDGDKVEESLFQPKDSFQGHTIETPWSKLQLVYFSSYATWNYLTTPFNFLMSGVQVKELEPREEGNEVLRRLEVIYPADFATHSRRQIFYYSEEGFLRRHDYWPEVLGGSSATQIVENYKSFSGIQTGTKRRIYILNEDGSYAKDPVLVSIDIKGLTFN